MNLCWRKKKRQNCKQKKNKKLKRVKFQRKKSHRNEFPCHRQKITAYYANRNYRHRKRRKEKSQKLFENTIDVFFFWSFCMCIWQVLALFDSKRNSCWASKIESICDFLLCDSMKFPFVVFNFDRCETSAKRDKWKEQKIIIKKKIVGATTWGHCERLRYVHHRCLDLKRQIYFGFKTEWLWLILV